MSILYTDSNPQPSERESPPITTRPRLYCLIETTEHKGIDGWVLPI